MTDPHAAAPDENPEDHLGEMIPDPWDDPRQTDWATETLDLGELIQDTERSEVD